MSSKLGEKLKNQMLLFLSNEKRNIYKKRIITLNMVESELLALLAIFLCGFFFGVKINSKLMNLKKYEF